MLDLIQDNDKITGLVSGHFVAQTSENTFLPILHTLIHVHLGQDNIESYKLSLLTYTLENPLSWFGYSNYTGKVLCYRLQCTRPEYGKGKGHHSPQLNTPHLHALAHSGNAIASASTTTIFRRENCSLSFTPCTLSLNMFQHTQEVASVEILRFI